MIGCQTKGTLRGDREEGAIAGHGSRRLDEEGLQPEDSRRSGGWAWHGGYDGGSWGSVQECGGGINRLGMRNGRSRDEISCDSRAAGSTDCLRGEGGSGRLCAGLGLHGLCSQRRNRGLEGWQRRVEKGRWAAGLPGDARAGSHGAEGVAGVRQRKARELFWASIGRQVHTSRIWVLT